MADRLRVVLADDEPLGRLALRQQIARHPDLQLCGEACDGREAITLVEQLAPDVLLLDVQMPELDGLGVIAALAETGDPPPTIFVTAHDSFAVRAFEAHALDYLLKPVAEARFDAALSRLRDHLATRDAGDLARRLLALVAPATPRPRERLVARLGDRSTVIAIADIDWIEAQDYYAAVHVGAAVHIVRHSLSTLETELPPTQFIRIHRNAMVNVARIRELHHGSNDLSVVLTTGARLPVSRRRRDALEQLLGSSA